MKKTVKVDNLVKLLRKAIRTLGVEKMTPSAPDAYKGSRAAVHVISVRLGEHLGLVLSTPEHDKFMRRIFGSTHMSVSKQTRKGPGWTSYREVRRRADQACTCDGGVTTGCSSCVAARELKRRYDPMPDDGYHS